MQIPEKSHDRHLGRLVQFHLPAEEFAELRELAQNQDRPIARLLREAVRRLLREDRLP
jgi:Ribbon-helix-helix protein, copG family